MQKYYPANEVILKRDAFLFYIPQSLCDFCGDPEKPEIKNKLL
jgi:hypothetical protein